MIRVKQHADDRSLNDLNRFLAVVDSYFTVDHWIVADLEILGENALAIEQRCGVGIRLADSDFREMYRGIIQTIWGRFGIEQKGKIVAQLDAIDSSYWEVTSADPAFETFMKARFGEYSVYPANVEDRPREGMMDWRAGRGAGRSMAIRYLAQGTRSVKTAIFIIFAIVCGFVALYYMGMSVQSVDYHDGSYHPIPRDRYVITFLVSLIATIVFWKLGRRSLRSNGNAK